MKNLKKENGVITIITLVTILFIVSFLISSYILVANKVKIQKEIVSETRKIYEPKSSMEEIYNSYILPLYANAKKNTNGILEENAVYSDKDEEGNVTETAVIPKGFKVSDKEGEKAISTGLVIQDEDGNEFVWVPVNYEVTGEINEHGIYEGFLKVFCRTKWSNNNKVTGLDDVYTEPFENGYQEENTEYYDMIKSVQKYRGFYIGRYEAGSVKIEEGKEVKTARTGSSGDTVVVIKRDQYPYNYVAWGSSMNNINDNINNSGHGAVYLSKHMYDKKDVGVTSTLCYGVQWDAILDFIKDDKHNVTNSTNWGNYLDNNWTITNPNAKYSDDSRWNMERCVRQGK